jgi:hypothetical protein
VSDETVIQTALAYLRQHRAQYELAALRQQLLAAGYPEAAVDAAIARLQSAEASGAAAAPQATAFAEASPPADPAGIAEQGDPLASAERERALQQMIDYLREHDGRYEVEALRQQLLAAGQDPELVAQAIARANISGPPPASPRAWPLGLGIAAINLFVLPFIFGGLAALAGDSDVVVGIVGLMPLLVLIGELVAGIVLLRGERRQLGKALLWGVGFSFALPLILLVLLAGICLIIIAGAGGFSP